jgi:hypothetical protein
MEGVSCIHPVLLTFLQPVYPNVFNSEEELVLQLPDIDTGLVE